MINKTGSGKKPLGLYLHFPFCVRKCRYCDFLSFPSDAAMREAYLKRLKDEIAWRSPAFKDYEAATIFIGGGTPSLMSGRQLAELMQFVYDYYQVSPLAEISMECNPGTVDAAKLSEYKKAGINRLSFGLQSMCDEELKYLGRIHTVREFLDNYAAARHAGFENINIDLMSALPGQSLSSWLDTLKQTVRLEPEHLSAYSLIIEEGTPFWDLYGNHLADNYVDVDSCASAGAALQQANNISCEQLRGLQGKELLPLPDEDTEREMYHRTKEILTAEGYDRYEISNYAECGFKCRHNLTYWYRGDYLGMGLGSASMVDNRRFSNTSDMDRYMAVVQDDLRFDWNSEEQLSRREQMEETMFLGLRCVRGVSLKDFEEQFGCPMMDIYGSVIEKYEKQGFLVVDKMAGRLYLTEAGLDVSNWILSDFLLS